MNVTASKLLTSSRTINAPADTVWHAIADLEQMGRRSPQCRAQKVLRKRDRSESNPAGIAAGSITVNVNRHGRFLWWPTWAVVTEFTPGKVVEFKIPMNASKWRFEITPGDTPEQTILTESRIVENDTTFISNVLVSIGLGGTQSFEQCQQQGIEDTLAAIAAEVEEN